jgi:hypothetical protein
LKGLKAFYFSETNITEIPPNTLNSTTLINIKTYGLKKVNNYSYNLLRNIGGYLGSANIGGYIDLRGSFDFIPSHAFVVKDHDENRPLNLYIEDSQINGSSFELGALINANRTLKLSLERNSKLTYLDEEIFKPLFEKYPNSTIRLKGCPLDCDDKNFMWIIENKDKILPQLLDPNCNNGKSLENITMDNFTGYIY